MKGRNSKTRKLPFIRVVIEMLSIAFQAAPVAFLLYIAASIGFTVLLVADLHLVRVLLDRSPLYVAGAVSIRAMILTIVLLGGINLIDTCMNGTLNACHEHIKQCARRSMTERMIDKASRLDLIRFEASELYNDIERAVAGQDRGFESMQTFIFALIFHGGYFLFLALYLIPVKPLLILGVFASFLPVAVSRILRTSVVFRTEHRVAPRRREFQYYESCLTDREFFKESRTSGAVPFFSEKCRASLRKYIHIMWTAEFKEGLAALGLKLLTLTGYAGLLLLLVRYVLSSEISPGMFGAIYFAMDSFFKWFDELLNRLGQAYENAGIGGNFLRFMKLPERVGSGPIPWNKGIDLSDVTFRYPGTTTDAVHGVTLTVHPGESIAIVGRNGAGKSTLTRLISGQYEPDTGTVTAGGLPVSKAGPEHEGISAVFQTFQKYRLSLRDNIELSDLAPQSDQARLQRAMELAGVRLDAGTFEHGTDTMLSREFGGIDLSLGQWQRIAIARGLYRRHEIIILDEPTASIDPVEESHLYATFLEATREKTAIIVTHRLGSARIAGRILVMQDGEIIEDGDHDSLMAAGGVYAAMFAAQSRWYER